MKILEFSIIMPCLNESRTLEKCIRKTRLAFKKNPANYEIIVADNGSSDNSVEIAKRNKAKVVYVKQKGYGSALQAAIEKAEGKFIIMGDADDSYDFSCISLFIKNLRNGDDFVIGNRFIGEIMSGAMPWPHKLGNPFFSFLGKLFFDAKVGDFYCGLRGFTKKAWKIMDLQTTGMEYAIEMVTKVSMLNMKVSEIPIVLYKDGRLRPSHLRTWRDGWKTLRFMLLFAPEWLFLLPGLVLFISGALFFSLSVSQPAKIAGITFDLHTLLVSSVSMIVGVQVVLFGLFAEIFVSRFKLIPIKKKRSFIFKRLNVEYGLIAGTFSIISGFIILLVTIYTWSQRGFGILEYSTTMRVIIPSVFLIQLGMQLIFNSFFLGVLMLPRKV